jgi:P27 family predicted phage terminase small subunit
VPSGGHNKKPDVIKFAEGTYRKDRAKKNPPRDQGRPRCPFAVSSIAGRKWKEIVDGLTRLGIIDKVDATHLEGLCRQYQVAKEADKEVKRHGMLVEGAQGQLVANPACNVSSQAWAKVRSYGNDLGLNHLSRQRMESTVQQDEADNIESKYLG